MGRVDGPAISGVAVNREGTGLVMVEVARFFSPALEAVAAGVEAGRVTSCSICVSFALFSLIIDL